MKQVYTQIYTFIPPLALLFLLSMNLGCGDPIEQGTYYSESLINGTFVNTRLNDVLLIKESYQFETQDKIDPKGTYTHIQLEYEPDLANPGEWMWLRTTTITGQFEWVQLNEKQITLNSGEDDTIPIKTLILIEESVTVDGIPLAEEHALTTHNVSFYIDEEKLMLRSFNRLDGYGPVLTGTWESRYERYEQSTFGMAVLWILQDRITIFYTFANDGKYTLTKEETYAGAGAPNTSTQPGFYSISSQPGFQLDGSASLAILEEKSILLDFPIFYRE